MSDQTQTTPAKRVLRRLRGPSTSGLESEGTQAPDLRDVRIKSSLDMARERFRQIAERTKTRGGELTTEQQQVLNDAEMALKKLAAEGDTADVNKDQLIGLEAIIIADGTRPALFVQDDDVDPTVPESGTWQGRVSELRLGIGLVAASVGRINAHIGFPHYGGTGFVVADGLILTNRHVLEALAVGGDVKADGSWEFKKPVTIDFAAEFERNHTRSFKVTGVAFAGPERIGMNVVLSRLDVALLHVEKNNGTANLPPPCRSRAAFRC